MHFVTRFIRSYIIKLEDQLLYISSLGSKNVVQTIYNSSDI